MEKLNKMENNYSIKQMDFPDMREEDKIQKSEIVEECISEKSELRSSLKKLHVHTCSTYALLRTDTCHQVYVFVVIFRCL